MRSPIKIAVVGTGYVGLVAGACFANWGHEVVCADKNLHRIDVLLRGDIPIYEPGLQELVASSVGAGRLSFTTETAEAVAGCDAVFIAVGTPPREPSGEADLSFVRECAAQIAEHAGRDTIIIMKSTVPVGTGDEIEKLVRKLRPDINIPVVSNPEFLREGTAIGDFQNPDRVVVGTSDSDAESVMRAIYRPVIEKGRPFVVASRRSAELTKYAANAFLAAKIAFINEMADLCEAVDADIDDIALGIGLDSRIGPQFLKAGPGYGGSCFPKDTLALVRTAQENGVALRIVEETVMSNSARKRRMVMKVRRALSGNVENRKIAVLGLTFKAGTDDMRESPSIPLIRQLQRDGAEIHAYDPQGMKQAQTILDDVQFHTDPYQCASQADAVVLMTDWEALKRLDLRRLASLMRTPVMVDLRRIYSPQQAARYGFAVETIGVSGLGSYPVSMFDPPCLVPGVAAHPQGDGRGARRTGSSHKLEVA